jgi:DNA primase
MRFPQTFIDDLRRQTDIVRLISDYVTLKKKGANWMACCPFHQEKTPSFSVSPAKDIFYCFSCGKGGSVFSFVMEMEHVEFPDAVRIVADKTGMPLPTLVNDKKFDTRKKEAAEVIQLNGWALEFWEQEFRESGEGRIAREYIEGRGISEETRKTFRIGYAPNSWDGLGDHLKKKGATISQIERSGLVVTKEQGGYYDRFRGRVIFPVIDAQGRPVAFGARAIRPEDEPKYLNSPETAAYTKGRHFYGLNVTRDEIRRKKFAILVEGYLDLIVTYQYGIRNVIASLGTALTPEQGRLLGRFARKVVVNYDGDRAGVQAAKRAIETLLAEDIEIKVLVLPDGRDPDDFLRTYGSDEYNKIRGEAAPYVQFVLDQALRERDLRVPSDKAAAVEEVVPFIRAVKNRIQKRDYFDIAMDALRVEEPSLRNELWKSISASSSVSNDKIKKAVVRADAPRPSDSERRLLTLLIHDSELRERVLPKIDEDLYEELSTGKLFSVLKELTNEGLELTFELVAERMDSPSMNDFLASLWVSEPQRTEDEAIDDVANAAECFLIAIRYLRVDQHIKRINVEIKRAEALNDAEQLGRLQSQHWDWTQQQKKLRDSFSSIGVDASMAFGIYG